MKNPALDDVRLDLPCQVPWYTMSGNDRVRFCTQCNLHVHNLSAMTADEAAAFLAMREGRVCVAYERRLDGSAVFAASRVTPLPVLSYRTPPAARRRWVVPAAVAGAVASAGAAAILNGKAPLPVALAPTTGTVMVAGGIGPPPAVQFDPRNPIGNSPGSTASCVANAIKHDATAKRLAATLPAGIDLIDVKYSVYPPGARPGWGRCYLLGAGPSGESPATVAAVLWLLPNVSDPIDANGEGAWARTAERVKADRGGEWLIDTDDVELSQFLANVLAEPAEDGDRS